MKIFKIIFLLITIFALNSIVFSQDKKGSKFGKITLQDFETQPPSVDSGSEAIVLADVGSSDFEGNTKGYFTLIFKKAKRVLLRKRNAFDEATVNLTLYAGSYLAEEKLEDVEATTYNVVNGNIVETKLEKTSVFKEKLNKYAVSYKFTLPNLSEGCIIEYKYTVKSPFFNNNIRSWSFQGKYPIVWSEYDVKIPPFFNYIISKQGFLPFNVDTSGKEYKTYSILDPGEDAMSSATVFRLSGDAKWGKWAMKDVPAFKNESYLTTSDNYISKIKFQLVSIRYSDTYYKQIMKDWYTTASNLLEDEDFGKSLMEDNTWMNDDLKKIIVGENSHMQEAQKIFEYIRDNFVCTDHDDRYLSQPLKKTLQTKKGNVVDINMLLTAMLIHRGYKANPVLLSTRENGKTTPSQALLSQYNYLITRVEIDSEYHFLDASVNKLGFGKLPEECYNGEARLIDKVPYIIPLSADSLNEEKSTFVSIINDEKGNVIGGFNTNLGYYESMKVREDLTKKKQDEFAKELAKTNPSDVEVSNVVIDSLKNYEDPVSIKYDVKVKFEDDIVYFNPMFNEAWKKNPFTSAERKFPVEMPYKMNELFTLTMDIPTGYVVDEIPKSARVNLNDDEGVFKYMIVNREGTIQLQVSLKLYKANFMPEDYEILRDFFSYVVKKESEQIVFKKKK